MAETTPAFAAIQDTLKRSAAALKAADVRFMLAGSVAIWARGGPGLVDDLDLMLPPDDVDRAVEVLTGLGMRRDDPPEDWLLKMWDGEVLVDLIFLPAGLAVDDELFARAEQLDVFGISMPVMAPEDVVVAKLFAMHEHYLDFTGLLDLCRPVREQIDWQSVRTRTEGSPYAKAFLVLADELGLTAAPPAAPAGSLGFPPADRRPARAPEG